MKKTSISLIFIFVILLIVNLNLSAANQVVTNNLDSGAGSLRQAIIDVGVGEIITFDADYTITLSEELIIDKSLTITGTGSSNTIIQADVLPDTATYRVIKITSGNVSISHMSIRHGQVPNYDGGGGIYIEGATSVTLNYCDVSNNYGPDSAWGGGIGCWVPDTYIEINYCTISNNIIDEDGGGIYFDDSGITAEINNSTISGNEALSSGAGLFLNCSSTLNDCIISNNTEASWGGGIYISEGVTLNDCTISNNSTNLGDGGGVYIDGGGILNNCSIYGNLANIGGGAYLDYGGTLNYCKVYENYAVAAGGAGGGAFLQVGGTLNNSLFYENTAENFKGGGVMLWYGVMNNCTVADNSANEGGGIYTDGNSIINNCIVWSNTATISENDIGILNAAYEDTIRYTCASDGVIDGIDGCMTSNPIFVDTIIDNYKLESNSPCIDVGNNLYAQGIFDLDGEDRIQNVIVDLGAYESGGILLHPDDVTIVIVSNAITITWSAVDLATSYKIYSSDDPYINFTEDITGTFNGESWSASSGGIKKFYYVKAIN